jgi:CHAD domain-containing protein
MAFQLKAKESVGDGVTRNVKRELEKVQDIVGARVKPREHGASENAAVHETRKCFKKIRAALRLVREELGDDVYHEENWFFRDAARPLTEVRDAEMLVETFDKLARQLEDPIEPGAVAKVRAALLAHQQDVARRVLHEDRALAGVKEAATRALARISDWRIDGDGWAALEGGLRRVYRTGHRALALAAEDPSVVNLHEWRKQAKYLWHQLQLLEPAWTGSEHELGDQVHELSQLLGDDHDLAVLRQTLAADPLTYGGHRVLKDMFAVVDRQRQELERKAFALGRQLYKDPPKVFTSRIEGYWKAWRARPASQPAPQAETSSLRPR